VIDLAEREGCSLARVAQDHGLHPKRLYWWRQRLEATAGDPAAGRFVPVRVIPPAGPSAPGFGPPESGVTVETPRGHRIRLARGFDVETFVRVLELVGRPC